MAPLDSNVRKLPEPAAPPYRNAPQNIEAEQAVLGAIIVNNEAFYRVSDFLEPQHFLEPIHQLSPAGKGRTLSRPTGLTLYIRPGLGILPLVNLDLAKSGSRRCTRPCQ